VLDPIIFEELLSYMDGEEARQFFAEFAEDAQSSIAILRRFAAGEVGFEKVRDQMHALSGAGRTVGAATLAAQARLIEYGREADLGHRATQVAAELDEALERALAAVARRLDKLA
jgi:HPt (histidine-containing phosphotransfer) domain-containing protein